MAPFDFTDERWHTWSDWRWTASPILTVFGIHGSIWPLLIPGFPLSMITGLVLPWFITTVCYLAFLVYCSTKGRTPYRQLYALYVQHVIGAQWRAR